jgi:dUTP pyrophosphatase
MTTNVAVKRLTQSARLPSYTTEGAAGFDLYADLKTDISIGPMERVMVPTGIAIQISDKNLCALCYARSGLAIKHGITLSNGVGVIDNDYTGEIMVGLVNLSNEAYTIQPHDRIAQIVLTPVVRGIFTQTEEFEQTQRGDGGFGSTGR